LVELGVGEAALYRWPPHRPRSAPSFATRACTADAHRVAERLSAWQRDGTLHDLFVHRTSMSYAALSAPVIARLLESGPASLSRPLIALDDDARVILLTARARRAEGAIR
jgi:hypothetical protein